MAASVCKRETREQSSPVSVNPGWRSNDSAPLGTDGGTWKSRQGDEESDKQRFKNKMRGECGA